MLLMDDSIIRGNNIRRARELLYDEAGVREAVLLSYTPPIGRVGRDGVPRGCEFGVDMPPNDNFIARGRTRQQIGDQIQMDIQYLSVRGMLRAFRESGVKPKNLCTYCIGGEHPFK